MPVFIDELMNNRSDEENAVLSSLRQPNLAELKDNSGREIIILPTFSQLVFTGIFCFFAVDQPAAHQPQLWCIS